MAMPPIPEARPAVKAGSVIATWRQPLDVGCPARTGCRQVWATLPAPRAAWGMAPALSKLDPGATIPPLPLPAVPGAIAEDEFHALVARRETAYTGVRVTGGPDRALGQRPTGGLRQGDVADETPVVIDVQTGRVHASTHLLSAALRTVA